MPRRRFVPVLVWVCLCLLGAWSAAAQPMVISQMEGDPMSAVAIRIVTEAYRRLDIEARGKLLPRERALLFADSGATDGELVRMAGIEAHYPNLIQVPEPVLTFDTAAFTTGLTFAVDGWESLRPYSLCILRGMKLAEVGTEGMRKVSANTNEQLIRMLVSGRCEVAVTGYVIAPEIEQMNLGPIFALEPAIVKTPLYHYVNRRHAALVPRLADALREMRADGTIAALLAPQEQAIQASLRRIAAPNR